MLHERLAPSGRAEVQPDPRSECGADVPVTAEARLRRVFTRPGLRRPSRGTSRDDGVDRPVYFSHHVRCVPVGADQSDGDDLDHPGAARRRPDDQSRSDHSRLSRHHQPDRSAARPRDRADRPGDLGRHVLNKLSTNSELIVMNAAGMSPWRLFRPFLATALVVSAMIVIGAWLGPPGCGPCATGRPKCAPTSSPTSCSPAASTASSAA